MRVRLKQQRLLDILAKSSLSQNHWAIKLGLSRGHWSAVVNGKYPFPSPKTRERLLEVFRVPFEELFVIESGPSGGADANFQSAIADRYLIDRQIGQGGMGTVYLARDVTHGRQVALKVVSPEAVSGIGSKQFLKEIRYTARLQHHHILPVYDSGEAAGFPYYVTPYIEGGSLREFLEQKGPLSLDDALRITDGVAQALQHAHEHQVLHCDVKPENVLLSGSGHHLHAYVADFGISRAVHAEFFEWGRRSEIDSSAGTPAYVSPEQVSGERNLNPRSDVYSLACVVFEMLSGKAPFKGTTTMETVAKRFTGGVPNLRQSAPHVPARLADTVAGAMALDPGRRHATAEDFLESLRLAAQHPRSRAVEAVALIASRVLSAGRRILGFKPSTRRQRFMDTMLQDVMYAIRSLLRRPAFAAVVVLTMALGIGMNTAIFSILYGVLWQPLPYEDPGRLMRIGRTRAEFPTALLEISAGDFTDLRAQSARFDDMVAISGGAFNITGAGDPERLQGLLVSAGFFGLLGTPLQVGRGFLPDEDVEGAQPVVILTDRYWQDRLDGDPDVLGRTMTLDGVQRTIVGVAPPGFQFVGRRFSLLVPHAWDGEELDSRGFNYLRLYGRLSSDVSRAAAVAELETIWQRLSEREAESYDGSGVFAMPLQRYAVRRGRTPLLVLGGAVALVLLIACANVANLMLARTESRQRELVVRAALGAGRARLVRQFLTESVLVSMVGGVVGLIAAFWGVRVLLAAFGGSVPRADEVGVNGVVLGFALGASVLTGIVVGLVPGWQSKPDHGVLNEGTRSAATTSRLRQTLVVTEVALALMLVTGAGLLLRSFWRVQSVDVGIQERNVLIAQISPPSSRYQNSADLLAFHTSLEQQLRDLPEVKRVGMVNVLPFAGGRWNGSISPLAEPDNEATFVEWKRITPEYFAALGIPMIRGRGFTSADRSDTQRVAIINEQLVRELFGERDPIGEQIAGWGGPLEIVGVVGNVKGYGVDQPTPSAVYRPANQIAFRGAFVAIRTAADPMLVVPAVRQIAFNMDPDVPVYGVTRMSDLVSGTLGNRRFQMTLLGIFAVVALLLGAVGIYGVMSYTVAQRTREVGVRLALGSSAGGVLRLVLGQGTKLALIGIAIGGIVAFAARQVLASLMYETSTADPLTYAAVAGLLLMVAALACYIPARRAANIDPMEALRYE